MTHSASGVLLDLMNNLSFDNPNFLGVLIPVMVAQVFGFGAYFYAIAIGVREKMSCYPPFVHTFFLAMDGFGVYYWYNLAVNHEYFWFFIFYAVALAVWCFLEIWSLYGAIKNERQEFYGKYYDKPVTVKQSILRAGTETVVFLGLIMLYSYFMGGGEDASMIKFYIWSIIIPVFFSSYLWTERRTRNGASMGLAIMLLLSILAGFAPNGLGMWTAISPYFNTPVFYFMGVVTSVVAIYNILLLKKLPPKPKRADGKRNIW